MISNLSDEPVQDGNLHYRDLFNLTHRTLDLLPCQALGITQPLRLEPGCALRTTTQALAMVNTMAFACAGSRLVAELIYNKTITVIEVPGVRS